MNFNWKISTDDELLSTFPLGLTKHNFVKLLTNNCPLLSFNNTSLGQKFILCKSKSNSPKRQSFVIKKHKKQYRILLLKMRQQGSLNSSVTSTVWLIKESTIWQMLDKNFALILNLKGPFYIHAAGFHGSL